MINYPDGSFSHVKGMGDYILSMMDCKIQDRVLIGENPFIRFECETDSPGQLCFHYSIKKWSLSGFKRILSDWGLILTELKELGIPYISARADVDDLANLKFFEMTGFTCVGEWKSEEGIVRKLEYRLDV